MSEDKKPTLRDWRDVIEKPWPEMPPITEETRQYVLNHPLEHARYDVRIRTGRFYTDAEVEALRSKVEKFLSRNYEE